MEIEDLLWHDDSGLARGASETLLRRRWISARRAQSVPQRQHLADGGWSDLGRHRVDAAAVSPTSHPRQRAGKPPAQPTPRQTPPPPPAAAGAPSIPDAPPPLPSGDSSGAPSEPPVDAASTPVPDGAVRLVKLMMSAARADGQTSNVERQTILAEAAKAGIHDLVDAEWVRPTPLSAIVGEITDPQQRADLYVLAYAIVRADETVNRRGADLPRPTRFEAQPRPRRRRHGWSRMRTSGSNGNGRERPSESENLYQAGFV